MGMKKLCCLLILVLLLHCMGIKTAGAAEGKYVALTFDDGPSGRFTRALLEGLEARGVKATFFLCGYRVEQFPALARKIAQQGHEIGTHSDRHKFFSKMSPNELCRDLARSVEKIEKATGQRPTLLRPPGGIYDRESLSQTSCRDLPIILWSVDPDDWCCSDASTVSKRVLDRVKSGDIILLHDMYDSSIEAALRIVDRLQAEGYCFLTVSQLAQRFGKSLEGGRVYYGF